MRCALLIVIATVPAAPTAADTILVPGDAATIQAGIDMAGAGDEVVVAAGTWNETIDLRGKAITLRSAEGSAVTTIDGGGTGHAVLRCISGETDDTLIVGFRITGGFYNAGSLAGGHGAMIVNASPRFEDCRFNGNFALAGAGAMVNGGAPRFAGCVFAFNFASDGAGLAVRGGADVRLDDSDFTGNDAGDGGDCFFAHAGAGCQSPFCTIAVCAEDPFCCTVDWDAGCVALAADECFPEARGGAIRVEASTLTLDGCHFVNNEAIFENPAVSEAVGRGGAVHASDGATVRIRGGLFEINDAPAGGGIYADEATVLVAGTCFDQNTSLFGGGIRSQGGTLVVVNALLLDNFCAFGGGGIAAATGEVVIANCLVRFNVSGFNGGLDLGSGAVVSNCIVRDNVPDQVAALATVRYSNVAGGFPGPGNINAAPIYENPLAGNYRLAAGSPGIDAGHVWALPDDSPDVDDDGDLVELVSLDADGAPRIADDAAAADTGCGPDAIVDMGPYERAGTPTGPARRGDVNGDGAVDVSDLVVLILQWGACPGGCCTADFDVDGAVTVSDLVTLILNWG